MAEIVLFSPFIFDLFDYFLNKEGPTLLAFHMVHHIIQNRLTETKQKQHRIEIGIISRKYTFNDCLQSNVFVDVTLRCANVNPKSWIVSNFESDFFFEHTWCHVTWMFVLLLFNNCNNNSNQIWWYNKLAASVCPLIHPIFRFHEAGILVVILCDKFIHC